MSETTEKQEAKVKCAECEATIVYRPQKVFALSAKAPSAAGVRTPKSVYLTCRNNHTNLYYVED
jgi:hypothetical protein